MLAGLSFALLGACAEPPAVGGARNGGPPVLGDWLDTIGDEHQDRKNRFLRLAARDGTEGPSFFDAVIEAGALPYGRETPVLRVVFPDRVFFDTGRSDLRADAARVLDLMADTLRRDVPDVAVFVAGHTDSRGDDNYNHRLSVARADAVAVALSARGIGLVHLWRVGFGEALPLLPNTTADNMARNRRVELLIAARPEAVATWLARQKDIVCAGQPAAVIEECQRGIRALPRVTAVPVPTAPVPPRRPPRPTPLPTIAPPAEAPGTVIEEDPRATVPAPNDERGGATAPPAAPGGTTYIGPADTIDLRIGDSRFEVQGVPDL
ncbi:outer membrane protein OmpA-like peptidoglycan-associated protein [Zavarzinia compransoris]|nr:outer membrane protein OmpA-like peptidoglycan-associated protein [Zavarzinia compransoris]